MAMETYRSYMEHVTVSDGLHEKLMALKTKAPAGRKAPLWLRAGALAACAVLLLAVGGYAVLQPGSWQRIPGQETSSMAITSESIDIAPETPGTAEPGQKSLGGYETHEVRANVPVVCYHMLPWIDYGEGGRAAADSLVWNFPPDAVSLTLTHEQLAALLGGEEALATHLDWSAYELTGQAGWDAGGTFLGLYAQGYQGPLDHWEFTVKAGELPAADTVLEESVTQEIWDVSVTADKLDGKEGFSRNVSFMVDGYGYRFRLTATDAGRAELLVSRLVRQMIVGGGLCPENLTPDGEIHLPPVPEEMTPPSGGEGNTAASDGVPGA